MKNRVIISGIVCLNLFLFLCSSPDNVIQQENNSLTIHFQNDYTDTGYIILYSDEGNTIKEVRKVIGNETVQFKSLPNQEVTFSVFSKKYMMASHNTVSYYVKTFYQVLTGDYYFRRGYRTVDDYVRFKFIFPYGFYNKQDISLTWVGGGQNDSIVDSIFSISSRPVVVSIADQKCPYYFRIEDTKKRTGFYKYGSIQYTPGQINEQYLTDTLKYKEVRFNLKINYLESYIFNRQTKASFNIYSNGVSTQSLFLPEPPENLGQYDCLFLGCSISNTEYFKSHRWWIKELPDELKLTRDGSVAASVDFNKNTVTDLKIDFPADFIRYYWLFTYNTISYTMELYTDTSIKNIKLPILPDNFPPGAKAVCSDTLTTSSVSIEANDYDGITSFNEYIRNEFQKNDDTGYSFCFSVYKSFVNNNRPLSAAEQIQLYKKMKPFE